MKLMLDFSEILQVEFPARALIQVFRYILLWSSGCSYTAKMVFSIFNILR